MGWVVNATPRPLYPRDVDLVPRTVLDGCGKSPHRNSIPGLSSQQPIAVPTEVSPPISRRLRNKKKKKGKSDSQLLYDFCPSMWNNSQSNWRIFMEYSQSTLSIKLKSGENGIRVAMVFVIERDYILCEVRVEIDETYDDLKWLLRETVLSVKHELRTKTELTI